MMIKPLGDHIVVQDIPPETSTRTGIYLPPTAIQSTRAWVVSVGPGRLLGNGLRNRIPLHTGDIVLVGRGGRTFENEGIKYRIVKAQDVVAVRE